MKERERQLVGAVAGGEKTYVGYSSAGREPVVYDPAGLWIAIGVLVALFVGAFGLIFFFP